MGITISTLVQNDFPWSRIPGYIFSCLSDVFAWIFFILIQIPSINYRIRGEGRVARSQPEGSLEIRLRKIQKIFEKFLNFFLKKKIEKMALLNRPENGLKTSLRGSKKNLGG